MIFEIVLYFDDRRLATQEPNLNMAARNVSAQNLTVNMAASLLAMNSAEQFLATAVAQLTRKRSGNDQMHIEPHISNPAVSHQTTCIWVLFVLLMSTDIQQQFTDIQQQLALLTNPQAIRFSVSFLWILWPGMHNSQTMYRPNYALTDRRRTHRHHRQTNTTDTTDTTNSYIDTNIDTYHK